MDKKPLIGVCICAVVLLVLASLTNVVGYQTAQSSNKEILNDEINQNITININGELGFSITICNNGNIPTPPIDWQITIDGLLVFFGKSKSGHLSEIPPGACVTIKSMVMGIGRVTITIQIGDIRKSTSGYIFGPFVIIH